MVACVFIGSTFHTYHVMYYVCMNECCVLEMSEDTGDQPAPQKGRRVVFVGKNPYWKTKKRHHTSSLRRRSSTSGAELFQVVAKVQKHPEFKNLSKNQMKEEAENLISLEYFRDQFSEFNERHVQDVMFNVRYEATSIQVKNCGHESKAAGTRATARLAEIGNINVKLQLRKLDVWNQGIVAKFASLIGAEYGPTHAALLIGNAEKGYVMLEWDGTSLIIPQYYDSGIREDVKFEACVATPVCEVDKGLQVEVKVAGEQLDHVKQIDLIFDAAVQRSKMFDSLFKVIIDYNKYCYYHMFSRNCQHFVHDAMQALGIKNPHPFAGRLKTYFEKLMKGITVVDFESHSNLDAHVMTRLGEATQQELEYYLCMYLHFHAVGRSQSSELDPARWKCEVASCQLDNVDQRIAEQESVLHHFLQ